MFDVTGPLLIVVLVSVVTFIPLKFTQLKAYLNGSNESRTQEVASVKTAPTASPEPIAKASEIPEDSVLKRHCLTNFRTEIEAAFAPRPTDSVLKRHHDALVAAELEKRLAQLDT